MILEQIPIRLAINLVSSAPVLPVDANTGKAPRFFRGQTVALQVGIFDVDGNPVDLSNLVSLSFYLQAAQDSPYALVAKSLLATDDQISELIPLASWQNGTQQNGTFLLSAADTDQSLGGGDSLAYWMIVQGTTSAGDVLTFCAGAITIYNAGSDIPIPTATPVSENEQTNNVGNFTVAPGSQDHVEIVTITGAAGTRGGSLSQTAALSGNRLRLCIVLPPTAGIVINIYNGPISGSPLLSLTTDGEMTFATFDFVWSDFQAAWVSTLIAVRSSEGSEITDNAGNPITDNSGKIITS